MARDHGARSKLAVAFEAAYGTAPASGYWNVPFVSTSLGEERPLLASELLGYGRDPAPPVPDASTVDGDVVIPLDAEALGIWLKGAFGQPTTTGGADKTHTYTSGGFTLPSMAIEKAMPNVPHFEMLTGLRVNTLRFGMQRGGLLTGTVGLIGQKRAVAGATAAGTPSTLGLTRFGHIHGSIVRDTVTLGNIVSAEVTYSNNLDPIEVVRNDGYIADVDPGMATLSGSLAARFDSNTLLTQATSNAPCELVFGFTVSATVAFTLTAHAVYLPIPRLPIEGAQGFQATFDWTAARAASPARMCTAVLKNAVTGYGS
jgi:hypothetical protein